MKDQETPEPTKVNKTNEETIKEVTMSEKKSQMVDNSNSKKKPKETNRYLKTKNNATEKTVEQKVSIDTTKTRKESRTESNRWKKAKKPKNQTK